MSLTGGASKTAKTVDLWGFSAKQEEGGEPEIITDHGKIYLYDDLRMAAFTMDRGCARQLSHLDTSVLMLLGDGEWTYLFHPSELQKAAKIIAARVWTDKEKAKESRQRSKEKKAREKTDSLHQPGKPAGHDGVDPPAAGD